MSNNIMCIILAAGSSKRLGQPKQLLPYKNDILINHTIKVAAKLCDTLVVLGAYADQIIEQLAPVNFIINPKHESGMGSSIACAIEYIDTKNYDGAILSLADQPLIQTENFEAIIRKVGQSSKGIICSNYGNIHGPPIYFSKPYFEQLKALEGDQGAKKILKLYQDDLETVLFEAGKIDIDFKRDLQYLE